MFTFGVILFAGCVEPITEDMVKEALFADFKKNNFTQGRYGWELVGKGTWFVGGKFNVQCLGLWWRGVITKKTKNTVIDAPECAFLHIDIPPLPAA